MTDSVAALGQEVGAKSTTLASTNPGSNRGPSDLQSDALPTELSRLAPNVSRQVLTDFCRTQTFGKVRER